MRKMMLISAACSVLGYAVVYFVFFSNPAPRPETAQPAPGAPPAEPVVLANVVDVTDVDPLLDPKPAPATGVPFDPSEPLEPVRTSAPPTAPAPAPIPRAAD